MIRLIRQCKECGKSFETKSSRKLFCDDDHYRICQYCGNSYLVPRNQLSNPAKTCSEECRRALMVITAHRNVPLKTFVCEECGETFTKSARSAHICDKQHYRKCVICGSEFPVTPVQIYTNIKTCSEACRLELVKQTSLQRYGVDNYAQSEESKVRTKTAFLNAYGVDNPMKLKSCQIKAQNTCLNKYGVTSFSKTPEFIDKCIDTNQQRYGCDWASQSDQFKAKSRATCLSKYGVDNGGKALHSIIDRMTNPSKVNNLLEFRKNPAEFITSHFIDSPTLSDIASECGILDSSVGWILRNSNNLHLIRYNYSKMEAEVVSFLSEVVESDCPIIQRTKQVITPYELDIYIPKYRVAFECNPTSTHNVNLPAFNSDSPPVNSTYHKMKTDLCGKQNIFLFHIFGYEWTHKQLVCKSMILNLLHKTPNKVYGRDTEIKDVSAKDSYEFLVNNHRQGGVHCKVRLGLYHDDQLVSLMTFSKMRNTLGTGKSDLSDCWELVRFCNRINTNVVGGASKLFKYFISQYNPQRIRSFSDRAHTTGKLYTLLGFDKKHESDPGYCWVNVKTDMPYSRVNAQKQNIAQFLHDDTIDLNKTEVEIMTEHGFVQIYDSGTILWEWVNR